MSMSRVFTRRTSQARDVRDERATTETTRQGRPDGDLVGTVLDLQRTIGNAAVIALVRPQAGPVQRRLSADPAALGSSSLKERATAAFGGENVFQKIKDALIEYHGSYEAVTQVALLNTMLGLIIKWFDGNKKARSTGGTRASRLQQLASEIHLEIPNAERQVTYMADIDKQQQKLLEGKRQEGEFKYLSSQAPTAVGSAQLVAKGKIEERDINKVKQQTDRNQYDMEVRLLNQRVNQIELMKKYGLSDAEIAAIKIYSVDDFKYINPAVAGNKRWLESQIPNVAGLISPGPLGRWTQEMKKILVSKEGMEQATKEGRRHAEMAIQGLKKLPVRMGPTFRGLRLTFADFKQQYVDTKQSSTPAFVSTSLEMQQAENFARGGNDGKVGILIHYEVTNGRDISMLSQFGGEKEILLFPGATMVVTGVRGRAPGPGINYDVWMTQTK